MEGKKKLSEFDVAVVGAGPVGCVTAISHARAGYRVVLLEANPNSANRLAGEWLHFTALDVLASLKISLPDQINGYPNGRGFAVFPEDGSQSVVLPYTSGIRGASLDHRLLVEHLRDRQAAVRQEFSGRFASFSAPEVKAEFKDLFKPSGEPEPASP